MRQVAVNKKIRLSDFAKINVSKARALWYSENAPVGLILCAESSREQIELLKLDRDGKQSPKRVFKDWVMLMFKCGADVVVASHPHVLQPAEFVTVDGRRCFAAYSLGNFVSSRRTLPRDAGVILNMDFLRGKSGKPYISAVSYVPTWVQFRDGDNKDDIAVLPVKDTLKAIGGGTMRLRAKDAARLKDV